MMPGNRQDLFGLVWRSPGTKLKLKLTVTCVEHPFRRYLDASISQA